MDSLRAFRGKTGSLSSPSFSIRFNPEEEELVEVHETAPAEKTEEELQPTENDSTKASTVPGEIPIEKRGKDSPLLSKINRRAGSLEESGSEHPWRFISHIKQITKTVEEKIECIKSERLKQSKADKISKGGGSGGGSSGGGGSGGGGGTPHRLAHNSSVSDSEERSETSSSVRECSSSPEKTVNKLRKHHGGFEDSADDIGTGSGQLTDESTDGAERATTPQITEIDVSDSPTPSLSAVSGNRSFNFWRRPKDMINTSYEYKVHRRRQKQRTEGLVEMGVEALDADFDPKRKSAATSSEKSFGGQSAKGSSPLHWLTPHLQELQAMVEKWRYFGCLNAVWNWWPLVFPVVAGVTFKVFEPPSEMVAFLVGALITVEANLVINKFQTLISSCENHLETSSASNDLLYDTVPLFNEKNICFPKGNPDSVLHEGWMNEFSDDYDPETYRISFTSTVYIRLEGSLLRIASPRHKVPKRAFWSEPNYKLLFDLERVYDISNCKVSILPEGLAHKRWWSKKYPICVELLPNSQVGVRYRDKGKLSLGDYCPPYSSGKTDDTSSFLEDSSPAEPKVIPDEKDMAKKEGVENNLGGAAIIKPSTSVNEDITDNVSPPDPVKLAENDSNKKPGIDVKPPNTENNNNVKKDGSSGDIDDSNHEDEDDDDDFVDDYVKIPTSLVNRTHLYLFARSDREKEIWFRRFLAASCYTSHMRPPDEEEESIEVKFKDARAQRESANANYFNFMKNLSQMKIAPDKGRPKFRGHKELLSSDVWVNAFIGRIVYDVLKDPIWHDKIKDKIQRKLSAIKVPVFLEGLMVSNLDIGDSVPVIEKSSHPVMNEYGIWIDLDVSYAGSFSMTVDTKLNLMKLKTMYNPRTKLQEREFSNEFDDLKSRSSQNSTPSKPAIFDSSVEDSAESSGDDSRSDTVSLHLDQLSPAGTSPGTSRPTPKVLSMVEKIAASKRFQQVTDMKYVKKAMEGVSNTNISLIVEVKGLIGTLVLNLPPPPSDRLWYGFRPKPKLKLSAQPKWGERTITVLNIAGWIEKKLYSEFQKLLVLPNMDDLVIPIMDKAEPS